MTRWLYKKYNQQWGGKKRNKENNKEFNLIKSKMEMINFEKKFTITNNNNNIDDRLFHTIE